MNPQREYCDDCEALLEPGCEPLIEARPVGEPWQWCGPACRDAHAERAGVALAAAELGDVGADEYPAALS